jgi:hypothetical protein
MVPKAAEGESADVADAAKKKERGGKRNKA